LNISHALGTRIKQSKSPTPPYVFDLPSHIQFDFQEDNTGYAGTSHLVNYSLKVEN